MTASHSQASILNLLHFYCFSWLLAQPVSCAASHYTSFVTTSPITTPTASFHFCSQQRSSAIIPSLHQTQWQQRPPYQGHGINTITCLHNSIDEDAASNDIKSTNSGNDNGFIIREGKMADLVQVAEVIVDSFYKSENEIETQQDISDQLDRLRYNFPRQALSATTNSKHQCQHLFVVACSSENESDILGFCELDGRTKPNPYRAGVQPPRPYLSDLAVRTDCRRRGIAKSMVRYCETMVQRMGHDCLHLRVERRNFAALRMYAALNYEVIPHDFFGVKDTTLLLQHQLISADRCGVCNEGVKMNMKKKVLTTGDSGDKQRDAGLEGDAMFVIDYQV